jgi:type II secretion system protein H
VSERSQNGFTLFEIVVVIVILGIMATAAALYLKRDPAAGVREQAQRLAALLQNLRQEAILEGTIYAVQFGTDEYDFLRLNEKGELVPVKNDDLLRSHHLPAGIHLEIPKQKSDDKSMKGIIFAPTGEVPEFEVLFDQGGHRWQVRRTPDGDITAGAAQ